MTSPALSILSRSREKITAKIASVVAAIPKTALMGNAPHFPKDDLSKRFKWGNGIVGIVARRVRSLRLTKIEPDYKRRNILKTLAAVAFLVAAQPEVAQAFLPVGVSVTSATVLTTVTIVNTSGSTVAANSIPPTFGHAFKQGDVPSGTWPQLQLTSGTAVPATIYGRVFWPDGSLQWAGFLARIPASIAGGGTITINVMNGGSAPSASSRTLSDLSAGGLNLNTQVTGAVNLTGVWNSYLNHGVSNTNQSFSGETPLVYGDGPAGKIWRVRASFEQSGAAHGQLEGYWYVMAPQDASGDLYGIRYLPMMQQPWYDNDTPAKEYRVFSTCTLQNGASVIRDQMATYLGAAVAQNFTWASGTNCTVSSSASLLGQQCVLLTTTGTLPAGLSTNTPYWLQIVNGTTVYFSTQQGNAGGVTITGSGSGTHTLTPYPYLAHFGGESFTGTTGMYNYIQGAGSVAADAPLRIQINQTYAMASLVYPAYDQTVSPTSNTPVVRYWNNVNPFTSFVGQTGERFDIGLLNTWSATHFYTQAANDETLVRCNGLIGCTMNYWFRDTTTKSLPVCNNTSYTGMPSPNPNFYFVGTNVGGFTSPDTTCINQVWSGVDFGHMPEFVGYAYLFTAEPHLLDAIMQHGNAAVMQIYPGIATATVSGTVNSIGANRNATINGTTYYGMLTGGQTRTMGWGWRQAMLAKVFWPSSPENPNGTAYFSDILTGSLSGWAAFNAMNTTYWQNNGVFVLQLNSVWSPWEHGYFVMALSWSYGLTGSSSIQSLLNNYGTNWWNHVFTANSSGWPIPDYEVLMRTTTGTGNNDGAIISNDNQINVQLGNVSWSPGTTLAYSPIANYTPANGDPFLFDPEQPIPSVFTAGTRYFLVGVSGNNFGLSATLGGSAITMSDSGSTVGYGLPATLPAGAANNNNGNDGYLTNILFASKLAKSRGVTVNSAMISDLTTRWNSYGGTIASVFQSNCKYAFAQAA